MAPLGTHPAPRCALTLGCSSHQQRARLGWRPQISFDELVKEMVASELSLARRDAAVAREGFKTYRHRE